IGIRPPGYGRLCGAIDSGDPDSVRAVLDSGVDPNRYPSSRMDAAMERDETPLNLAVDDGNAAIVTLLLDHGADPNQYDGWHGMGPLGAAIETGNVALIPILARRGAKVNDDSGGSSVLTWAATSGKYTAASALLDSGALPTPDVIAKVKDQRTGNWQAI